MDLKKIKEQARKLGLLAESWDGTIDPIERDITLGLLRDIYSELRFHEVAPKRADQTAIVDILAPLSCAMPQPSAPSAAATTASEYAADVTERAFDTSGEPEAPEKIGEPAPQMCTLPDAADDSAAAQPYEKPAMPRRLDPDVIRSLYGDAPVAVKAARDEPEQPAAAEPKPEPACEPITEELPEPEQEPVQEPETAQEPEPHPYSGLQAGEAAEAEGADSIVDIEQGGQPQPEMEVPQPEAPRSEPETPTSPSEPETEIPAGITEAPAHEPEQPKTTLGDTMNGRQTLGETLRNSGGRDMASKIAAADTSTLRASIGINDKFLMIRDMFEGDPVAYDNAISRLEEFSDLDEAIIFIHDNYEWSADNEGVKRLVELLERKLG